MCKSIAVIGNVTLFINFLTTTFLIVCGGCVHNVIIIIVKSNHGIVYDWSCSGGTEPIKQQVIGR